MRTLHPDVASTAREMVITETDGYRLRLEKWEVSKPDGLFAIDLTQESLNSDGKVVYSSTYNFHMTKEELQALAYGLTQ
jgi:hypothetical protein